MNEYRIESDSLGEVKVPRNRYWGAQTQRSKQNLEKNLLLVTRLTPLIGYEQAASVVMKLLKVI